MRKVIVMNGKYVDHSGMEYKVKEQNWTPEETTYTVIDTFDTFEEVVQSLKTMYNHIEFCEEINEDEIQDLYFGFNNGIKEKVRKYLEVRTFSNCKLSKDELDIILQNMTMFSFSLIQGHFHFKPFLGIFGNYERLNIEEQGNCFYKNKMMGGNKIKIVNSYFTYDGNASLKLSPDCRSLELKIVKGRRTIELKFVPKYNRKY